MCFIVSFGPATFWFVIGFLVLYFANKSDGRVRKFGMGLAIWIFVLASLIPVMGAYLSISGLCPITDILQSIGR